MNYKEFVEDYSIVPRSKREGPGTMWIVVGETLARFKCNSQSIRTAKDSAKKIGGKALTQTIKYIVVKDGAFDKEELEANYKNKVIAEVGGGRWLVIPKRAAWATTALINRAKEIL